MSPFEWLMRAVGVILAVCGAGMYLFLIYVVVHVAIETAVASIRDRRRK